MSSRVPDSSSTSDAEKQAPAASDEKKLDGLVDKFGIHGAHILDASQLRGEDIKTTPDGKTILIPQPTDDPNDPLNWTFAKKHTVLAIISLVASMGDFGSTMGIVTLLPQAMYGFPYLQTVLAKSDISSLPNENRLK